MTLALLLFCSLALPLAAVEDVVQIENWRVKAGDDPNWALQDFDDSKWEASSWPRRHSTGQPFFTGIRWYHAAGSIPPDLVGQPLAIAIAPLDEVFEVFINGTRIGTYGNWEPSPTGYFPRFRSFPIPASALQGTKVQVAIRRWTGATRTNFASLVSSGVLQTPHAPEIGPAALIRTRQDLRAASNLNNFLPNLMANLGMVTAGILSLAMFFAQRASRENLWLGLALCLEGLPPLIGLAVGSSTLPLRSVIAAVLVGSQYFTGAIWSFFLASICPRLKKPLRLTGLLQGLIAVAMAICYASQRNVLPGDTQFVMPWIAMAATVAAAIVLLRERRGLHSTILATVLFLQPAAQFWFTQLSLWLGFKEMGRFITIGGLVIDPRNLAKLLFAITAVGVLYVRHRREQDRQVGLDRELAAARLVQESLLVGSTAETPGFVVEAAYLPASELGGDFYRTVPAADGSLLVLVGDVSGKGLRAALLVGHISGALSNERSRQPAEMLANLNASLVGRVGGGFVTCCCARFDPDGVITVANAGHLQPYIGGREMAVEAGLPLGVVSGTEYVETQVAQGRSEPFVLVSDGVVEAANPKNELFGFERTREMSSKAAGEIAGTAKAWGQNDDITVVIVRRSDGM